MHQQPAGARACLAGEREAALDGEVHRPVEVGVLHDDERVLAAELHLRAGREWRGAVDLLAGGGRAGERNGTHDGRFGDDRTDFAGGARDEVERALGRPACTSASARR
jgi:hypothetical protein